MIFGSGGAQSVTMSVRLSVVSACLQILAQSAFRLCRTIGA